LQDFGFDFPGRLENQSSFVRHNQGPIQLRSAEPNPLTEPRPERHEVPRREWSLRLPGEVPRREWSLTLPNTKCRE